MREKSLTLVGEDSIYIYIFIYIYTHTHTYIHIYIYIYIKREIFVCLIIQKPIFFNWTKFDLIQV